MTTTLATLTTACKRAHRLQRMAYGSGFDPSATDIKTAPVKNPRFLAAYMRAADEVTTAFVAWRTA